MSVFKKIAYKVCALACLQSEAMLKTDVLRANGRPLLNACGTLLLPLHHTFCLALYQVRVDWDVIDIVRSIDYAKVSASADV